MDVIIRETGSTSMWRDHIMKMKKICIQFIGTSGSGKTMTLSSLFRLFFEGSRRGRNGAVTSCTINEHDAGAGGDVLALTRLLRSLSTDGLIAVQDANGRIGHAAAGTVQTTNFHFNFDIHTPNGAMLSEVMRFTDYRGGILSLTGTNIRDIDAAECNAFQDSLSEADVVVILIDGIKLAQFRNNETLRKKRTGADCINTIMNAYMRQHKRGITTIVMVTKTDSDQIPDDLKADNFRGLCELARKTLDTVDNMSRVMTSEYGWNLSVIPVSAIGHGNSVTRYIPEIDEYTCALRNGADIRPENMDTALMYGIKCAITHRARILRADIEQKDAMISRETAHIGLFDIRRHKENIAKYTRDKEESQRLLDKYNAMLTNINDGFSGLFQSVRRFGIE